MQFAVHFFLIFGYQRSVDNTGAYTVDADPLVCVRTAGSFCQVDDAAFRSRVSNIGRDSDKAEHGSEIDDRTAVALSAEL